MERVWDYTTLDIFQTCRKKYYYWNVLHLKSKRVSPALSWGILIHSALEHYYSPLVEQSMRLNAALKYLETAPFEETEGELVRTRASAIDTLETYARVYKHEPFTIAAKPEAGFVFPVGDVLYSGRIDTIIDWDGALWVLEHKTTASIGSSYFNQFDMDKQATGYILGVENAMGKPCQGCMINAIQPIKKLIKPTSRSKTPEEHFARAPLTRTKFQKERFILNVNRIVRDILWCEENHEFYEAEKKDVCFHYNYNCPYKELCMYGEDSKVMERDFTKEVWEPHKVKEDLE